MPEPTTPQDGTPSRGLGECAVPASDQRRRRFRTSDLIIELGLAPFAVLTVLGLLYYTGFHAEPGTAYGIPAIVLGLGWLAILWLVDGVRYRRRAALLLSVPFILVVCTGWFAVYELGMESRGLVEDCPVASSRDYMVDQYRRPVYWETEYSLDCTQDRVTVTERLDGEPYEPPDPGQFGDSMYGTDQLDYEDPSAPEAIEVQYDPRGLLDPRYAEYVHNSGEPLSILTGVLLLIGISIRLVAASSLRNRISH